MRVYFVCLSLFVSSLSLSHEVEQILVENYYYQVIEARARFDYTPTTAVYGAGGDDYFRTSYDFEKRTMDPGWIHVHSIYHKGILARLPGDESQRVERISNGSFVTIDLSKFPKGPWRNTCRLHGARFENGILSASCVKDLDFPDEVSYSSIEVRHPNGGYGNFEIKNLDGMLAIVRCWDCGR